MKRAYPAILFLSVLAASCVRNDIPYPVVTPHIISMKVDGAKSAEIGQESIHQDTRTVDIVLEENVDLKKVNIRECNIDVESVRLSQEIVGVHDMTAPLEVTLSTYQDYKWTLNASRPIERYFTVDGQVDVTFIDVTNRRALAYVRKSVPLTNVKVTSLKLGPKDVSTYSVKMEDMHDFSEGIEVEVKSFGDVEYWTLYVEQSDISVSVKKVNVWAKEVYISAVGVAGQKNGFKYRGKGSIGDWDDVDQSQITYDGGQFTAHITGLEPSTTYEYYAYSGSDMSEASEFTTDPARQLPNSSFEYFSLVKNADYYKWFDPSCSDPESQDIWWACGSGEGEESVYNGDGKGGKSVVKGTGSLGVVLTFPDSSEKMDGSWSVRCESKNFAGLLACGNIFTGRFAGLEGTTGGAVNYGRPWTTRPHALRLWLKYKSCPVTESGLDALPPGENVKAGDNDRGEVAISLGKWDYRVMKGVPDSPVRVNTAKKIYYNSKSEGIIAFGHVILDKSTDGWQQVEIPLEYRDSETVPTHIIITCASSYLGDYLIGGPGSTLWVDKMELVY